MADFLTIFVDDPYQWVCLTARYETCVTSGGDWGSTQPKWYCLVVWLPWILFSHILGIIIPIDFHIFQRGSNHQPVICQWISPTGSQHIPWRRDPKCFTCVSQLHSPRFPREVSNKPTRLSMLISYLMVSQIRPWRHGAFLKNFPGSPSTNWNPRHHSASCMGAWHEVQILRSSGAETWQRRICSPRKVKFVIHGIFICLCV